MALPFVIDNQQRRLADALNELLGRSAGKPLDIATAYFAISSYRLVQQGLHQLGAFRLLLRSEPQSGADVGLKPGAAALKKRLQGDLEAEPFSEATLKLIEELIAFLRTDRVEVRLYDKGFALSERLHANLRPSDALIRRPFRVQLSGVLSLRGPHPTRRTTTNHALGSSRTALNGLTLAFAKELAGDRISVNSVCPGWVKTEMGTAAAPRTVEQGAAIAVRLATMADPPAGKLLDDRGEIPW
jgi:NAD(P)-dependent dehydrogenase (short-subunit alcohol dehydrogenase family)